MIQKLLSMRIRKLAHLIVAFTGVLYTYYFFGVGDYLFAKSFDHQFNYPLDIDVRSLAEKVLEGNTVNVEPINQYPHSFLTTSTACDSLERVDLVILVKSAMDHYNHRNAIRQTYGQKYATPGTLVRTLFFIGVNGLYSSYVQDKVDIEMGYYKDMIQMDFIDDYFSNTNKTMMAFRWAFENCGSADFYLFTDDDMYISLPNLLDFARYGDAPLKTVPSMTEKDQSYDKVTAHSNKVEDRDKVLYAGHVFNSAPLRFKSSKWVVSLDEYPWNKWPPYITAGAYIVSNKALKLMYVGSKYIKHFRFDDIYLGIVAKKLKIKLTHSPRFNFYKKEYTKAGYKDVIASHGYGEQAELVKVWREQHAVNVLSA